MESAESMRAPALARGITVLRLLGDGAAWSLDQLGRATAAPKSSLLRILDTLLALDLIARDDLAKTYTARAQLLPLNVREDEHFSRLLLTVLDDLAAASGQTAEWYVPGEVGMMLTERAEPDACEVSIRARVGFFRPWWGELDAVAQLAHAWFSPPARGESSDFWRYDRHGERQPLSARQSRQWIVQAVRTGCGGDRQCNPNGVRRRACVVVRNERPAGVLALAEVVSPAHTNRATELDQLIREQAQKLFPKRSFPWQNLTSD